MFPKPLNNANKIQNSLSRDHHLKPTTNQGCLHADLEYWTASNETHMHDPKADLPFYKKQIGASKRKWNYSVKSGVKSFFGDRFLKASP